MKPLSQRKRRFIFLLALGLFVLAVPVSVFYAIGYRFDFSNDLGGIRSVGGMYVRSDAQATEMFINDEPVTDMRVFQSAAYIQNLEAGMHRIHVQGEGLQTWVKNLPVYAHFVTEVASFNMPETPQIRIIPQWLDPQDGNGVVFETATSTYFDFASTTNTLHYSTSTATSLYEANPEYAYVENLIASSTEMKAFLEDRFSGERFRFGAVLTPADEALVQATSTKASRDFVLFEDDGEVYMTYTGAENDLPYYYCVVYSGKKRTSLEYGEHVYESLRTQLSPLIDLSDVVGERLCRTQIRIDRLEQEVLWFDFFPGSTDLVLMHLQDGLYVVEVDDRAWQNTQLLYPGENLEVVEDGGRIYIKDGEYYLEVFTEITS